jgi:hypothetical protein
MESGGHRYVSEGRSAAAAPHQNEIAARDAQLVSILPDRQQFVRRLPDAI